MGPGALPALALALALLPVTACGDDGDTTLTVLAAASLGGTFQELAERFEADRPGVEVRLAFDSSATLARQAVEGAPADVLATADSETMHEASPAVAGEPRTFATNTMVLVTPAGNPAGLGGIDDLTGRTAYVACVPSAPCGRVARSLLDAAGVTAAPASLEVDVRGVLARVTDGEADAGIVYATDAHRAGSEVERIGIPGAEAERTACSIAPLRQSRHPRLARAFSALVRSAEGRRLLTAAGFGPP